MKKQFYGILGIAAVVLVSVAWSKHSSAEKNKKAMDAGNKTEAAAGIGDWKLGVQLWTFRVFTMTEALQKVDSCGIKYVEAFWGQALDKNSKDAFGAGMSQAGRDKLKALLKSHHIKMIAMGVIAPNTKEEWIAAVKLAKEFELSYITAEPKKNMWGFVDSLAGANAIKIAIHDHPKPNAYSSPDSVIAAMAGHPNIGSCADVGHWARNGLDPVECLKKLEGHIYGVHLKDIVEFNNPRAADTVVGKGVIQFAPIFAELKRQNFKGMLSIEHESNWYHSVPDVMATAKLYNAAVSKLK